MIKTCIYIFALSALVFGMSSNTFAQNSANSKVFKAVSSGLWSDPKNWQAYNGSVELPTNDGAYPGEEHNREVNVRIDDGNALVIKRGDVVHINSLAVGRGNLVVFGDLIIGDGKDVSDPENNNNTGNSDNGTTLSATDPVPTGLGLELDQNVPNPVSLGITSQTTFKFYLDQQYSYARLHIYDELGNEYKTIYDERDPSQGWKSTTLNINNMPSGSYPVFLEVPGKVIRRMMTVIK
jgi:hypothetical protein